MFRIAGRALQRRVSRTTHLSLALAAGATVASVTLLSKKDTIHNDAKVDKVSVPSVTSRPVLSAEDVAQELKAHAWGSNSKNILDSSATDVLRVPTETSRLSGVAWRDVALSEAYGAAVDASGDVYQWGSELGDIPICILKGKVRCTIF